MSCYSILFVTWTITGNYKVMAQTISSPFSSILPGHAIEKTFQVGQPTSPISFTVSTDSNSAHLEVLLSHGRNSNSTSNVMEPLLSTSFIGEFEFNFAPKANSQYDFLLTNLGLEPVSGNIDLMNLVLPGEKVEDIQTQNIKAIFVVVIFGSIIITLVAMIKMGIMGKIKYGIKPRR